jgi:hypothetical protein
MLKDFPKCAWEITRIRRHSLVGEPGGGGFGFEIIFKQSISQGEERHEKPTEISCSFFFFGLIEVVKMAFGIEGSLHGWNINYHVRNQV